MRGTFIQCVTEIAAADPRVFVLTADLGFNLFNDFQARCAGRFLNLGVAEANMIGVAAGLALAGKRPFAYSIATFATLRCLEQIRNDICEMRLPVIVVGVGGGYAYGPNGATHHAIDDIGVMRSLPGMTVVAPSDPREVTAAVHALFALAQPAYLRLGRSGDAVLSGTDAPFVLGTPTWLRRGSGIALVACGPIAAEALRAAELLQPYGLDPAVLSAHTIKPLGSLLDHLDGFERLFVIEEHGPCGGLYEAVAGAMMDRGGYAGYLVRLSAPDRFHRNVGSPAFLRRASGIDAESIATRVRTALEHGHR